MASSGFAAAATTHQQQSQPQRQAPHQPRITYSSAFGYIIASDSMKHATSVAHALL
jgi:hypothetical protein